MKRPIFSSFNSILAFVLWLGISAPLAAQDSDVARLVAAMLGDTPMISDLQQLTDEVGGRATGSEANLKSVEWALARFKEAGVEARKEGFMMSALWLEKSATAKISGAASFFPRVACMPFSTGTPASGITVPLVDGGFGKEEDFLRLGETARGAFVLIETHELLDLNGLFKEYSDAALIEQRAFAANVAGVVYTGSRSRNVLYRHNASLGPNNKHPMLVMERDAALRCLRLLRMGKALTMTAVIDVATGPAYESYNVVGEIKGTKQPEEFVVIGAHLDSWEIGQGALDNGCNVTLIIDLARQMKRLGLKPLRTIRFALFNGEEQGLNGSWGYCRTHADELDHTVMASSYDIGSGRIIGFFTGGRPELAAATDEALQPIAGLGPFTQIDAPIVGTDNFDFMMEGVGNLVANQESANYGPNYHAGSDTFDKVDLRQLRLNAAIAAAVTHGFATMEVNWKRLSRAEVEKLISATDLGAQMKSFNVWDDWAIGKRGRQK
jgi:hypothetical protein